MKTQKQLEYIANVYDDLLIRRSDVMDSVSYSSAISLPSVSLVLFYRQCFSSIVIDYEVVELCGVYVIVPVEHDVWVVVNPHGSVFVYTQQPQLNDASMWCHSNSTSKRLYLYQANLTSSDVTLSTLVSYQFVNGKLIGDDLISRTTNGATLKLVKW